MLDDGMTRQYSLCGDPHATTVWRVAVLLNPNSRGGSRYIHEKLREGDVVRVRGPRNHFPLVDASHYRFIAGGIGITPLMPMIDAIHTAGGDWSLVYVGRTRGSMAFADHLAERYPDRVTLWPRDERDALELQTLLTQPESDTLVYCCGPERLLADAERQCSHWPDGALRIERFAAKAADPEHEETALDRFEVVCRRSGVTLEVTADRSILEMIEEAGISITTSCYEGVCGSCEARVLEGTPDHRDSVLSTDTRTSGEVMLVCVSRSCTEKLVLDL
jgi:ferredoxin-NADP reductase